MIDPSRVWPLSTASPESAARGLEARADLWSGVDVLGIGWTARSVRELHVVAHGLVRVLVEKWGFGSVLVEGDREASEALDSFVRDGTGDPRAVLSGARPFLATEEMLELVLGLRRHNEQARTPGVRMVHGGADDLSSPAALEHSLAEQILTWRQRFGDRIVYLGGAAHTAVAADRVITSGPAEPVPSAGSLLRDRFGAGYCSVGLTFGSGHIPQAVPAPASGSLEAQLDELPHETVLVDSDGLGDVQPVLGGADRVRLVGPNYDPGDDARHAMLGDPTEWFDVVVHQREATSVRFLS